MAQADALPQPQGRVSAGIMAGRILTRVPPVYPAEAKAAHVSGTVILHAIISAQGLIEQLNVISGPDMLRQAAVDAVRQWTYKPYVLNGVPTSVDTTITVNFLFSPPVVGGPSTPDARSEKD